MIAVNNGLKFKCGFEL